ncbi:MAG: hypothetical protein M1827_007324 [Pycnora praestabilis]|nr:MAG: hypothetical protein M1827_007324 [Pycnora praestabilis]
MAPYRPGGRSNRSGRTQIDHDVFEGLPVRHWRRTPLTVGAPPRTETVISRNLQPELPMPKEAHLLSPMSRALLQAARAGTVNKPPEKASEEEKEGGDEDEDGETERGFVAKRWTVLPRHLEGPEPEYLAKRRKGLPSAYSGIVGPLGSTGTMKRTKVKKVDVEGNIYVLDVLVPEGQKVEGEIMEEMLTTDAPAPGTVVEGVGIVNADGVVVASEVVQPTPPRRRPPPPRRKPKGPGRGRKKKVQFAPGENGTDGVPRTGDGTTNINGSVGHAVVTGADGIKTEDIAHEGISNGDGDMEMADYSNLAEGDEEDDENDEGEEGDEGDDDDREEGELSPSPDADAPGSPSKSPAKPPPPTTMIPSLEVDSPSLDLSLPAKPVFAPPALQDPSNSRDLLALAASGGSSPKGPQSMAVLELSNPNGHQLDTLSAVEPSPIEEEHPAPAVESLARKKSSDVDEVPEVSILPEPVVEEEKMDESVEGHDQSMNAAQCSDGEIDLLGNLERSLDSHGAATSKTAKDENLD